MDEEKQKLYNEMKKLSKRANQRIVRLEKLTGRTNILAVKELKEKLTIEQLKGVAWTKYSRTSARTTLTETQMIAEIKALQDFLEGKSTITSVKSEKARIEKSIGKKVSWYTLDVFYNAKSLYKWANETYGSLFWTELAPKVHTMEKTSWVDMLDSMQTKINDRTIRNKLKVLYDLLKG